MDEYPFMQNKQKIIELQATELYIVGEKGTLAQPVNQLHLCSDGICGDRNYGETPKRQVCLLNESAWIEICSYRADKTLKKNHGLCTLKCKPNIIFTTKESLKEGDIVSFTDSETQLCIMSIGKSCYPECSRAVSRHSCPLVNHLLFAQVTVTGVIMIQTRHTRALPR